LPLDLATLWLIVTAVRKLMATFLLICVGLLIPASASPVRFCLLELALNFSPADAKCCSDCSRGTELPDPCCVDLEEMPDSTAPQTPIELPPAIVTEVPAGLCPIHATTRVVGGNLLVSTPIRGPTSPAAYRAVLGIWRL
jgi:hypothetical protein